MANNFKVTLSNAQVYEEAELPARRGALVVGTGLECDVRLREELFAEPFEVRLTRCADDSWTCSCSANIHMGDAANPAGEPLFSVRMVDGSKVELFYNLAPHDAGAFLTLYLVLDFEVVAQTYGRSIDVSTIDQIDIGAADNCLWPKSGREL
jgi:hypothetical protein